jgi:hypothetical protein
MRNVKIVDEGAPLGIVGAVCANEANQARTVEGQLDELIGRRMVEPLAPYTQPLRGQVSVEKRVVEGASIVLTPATRVKRRDSLGVERFRWPILDHLSLLGMLLSAGSPVRARYAAVSFSRGASKVCTKIIEGAQRP